MRTAKYLIFNLSCLMTSLLPQLILLANHISAISFPQLSISSSPFKLAYHLTSPIMSNVASTIRKTAWKAIPARTRGAASSPVFSLIQERQSLDVTRTLLFVSVSAVCYHRNIIPGQFFETHDYESVFDEASQYVEGLGPNTGHSCEWSSRRCLGGRAPAGGKTSADQWNVICREKSPGAAKVMKWLVMVQSNVRSHHGLVC